MARSHKDIAAHELIRMGVPMIYRTPRNGRPGEWLLSTLTKKDKFYRINGKIVSGNMARYAVRAGLIGEVI